MIVAPERDAWRELESELIRPFVARRVRAPADVDDVVQDVLLRMQRGLADLRDEERLAPWIRQVARSAIIDHHRVVARHPLAAGEAPDLPAADDDGDTGDGAADALARSLATFVAALPSPYREALTLTELEALTQREAAEMVGVSLSGMKSRVQRGRVMLRRALEDCCRIALDARGRVVECEPRPEGDPPPGCCDRRASG